MAQHVEGTGYNGENDDNQVTQFEQWLIDHEIHDASSKLISSLMKNGLNSMYESYKLILYTILHIKIFKMFNLFSDMLRGLKGNENDINEVAKVCGLSIIDKLKLKEIINKIPSINLPV